MPTIHLETIIRAPIEICFDLSRSIDMHLNSMSHTNETAIAGVTSGLIQLGESVTWEAVHLGFRQRLTVQIMEMNPPFHFVDEMTKGIFHTFRHTHEFTAIEQGTRMIDHLEYRAPLGVMGRIADKLFLERYLTNLLTIRNHELKRQAEQSVKSSN